MVMRLLRPLPALCLLVFATLTASPARAQYRNREFGMDFSYMLVQKPPMTDKLGLPLRMGDRGNRLARGLRLGGEASFKLHRDHWWFSSRLDVIDYMFAKPTGDSIDQRAELLAAQQLGFNMGLEGLLGVRYYFLTDRVRPYLQVSMSYQHIFSFGSGASERCTDPTVCAEQGTYGNELMPRRNFLIVHAAPGIEFVVGRDVAVRVLVEYARWLTFRGKGNNVFTGGVGFVLYG